MKVAEKVPARARLEAISAGSVFAVVWALANIIHLLSQSKGDLAFPSSWLNLAAALYVLGRATSAHRLAVLAATQILDTVWLAPFAPDHQILACAVNVAVLMAYVKLRRPQDVELLRQGFAPAGRVLLLVAYAAAATAKYNSDFLDPASSCASYLAGHATFGLLGRESVLAQVYIFATIAVETSVPILLLVRRTRRWGVLFAALFHFMLCLSPAVAVGDFSMVLWALFLLFLSPRDAEVIGSTIAAGWREAAIVRWSRSVPRLGLGVGAVVVVWLAAQLGELPVAVFVWIFTTLFGIWVLGTTFVVMHGGRENAQRLGKLDWGQLAVVAALVLVVASPYLGFGTSSRFTMFSGVRTEGQGTNHYFLPSFHLIESQNEALIVLDGTGSTALEIAGEEKLAYPIVEIRRSLEDTDAGGTFQTLDGDRIVVRPGEAHWLREQLSWLEAKTQHYRPFKVDGITHNDFCSN